MSQSIAPKLAGKIAVVTGASKGIGTGIAKELAAEGAQSAGLVDGDFRRRFEAQAPLGRIGQPRDAAAAASFLAAADSGWITGGSFHVSGGFR